MRRSISMAGLKVTIVLGTAAIAACGVGLLSQRYAVDEHEFLQFKAVDGELTTMFEAGSGEWRASDGQKGAFEHRSEPGFPIFAL